MTRPVVFPSVSGRIAYQANGGTRFASGGSGGLSGAAAATITIGGGNAGF